jgi:hypothetical protein
MVESSFRIIKRSIRNLATITFLTLASWIIVYAVVKLIWSIV